MTYFADLSPYAFGGMLAASLSARNVGWLDERHEFPTEQPRPDLPDAVWEFCSILVVPTRGLHSCGFCSSPTNTFVRHGTKLLLGSGEIRVFASTGEVFAAPNLIYHYILDHHYRPPPDFLRAVEEGPRPGSEEYLELLRRLQVAWREHLPLSGNPETIRFVRTENGVEAERGKSLATNDEERDRK